MDGKDQQTMKDWFQSSVNNRLAFTIVVILMS